MAKIYWHDGNLDFQLLTGQSSTESFIRISQIESDFQPDTLLLKPVPFCIAKSFSKWEI